MRYRFLLCFGSMVSCFFSLMAQQTNHPASSEEITIVIDKDSISAFGMLAAGPEKKETVLLLHGLPGNERSLDLAHELRRNGRNVIYFNYRGAWGSQGNFTYANCLEDVKAVLDFFTEPANAVKYRVDPNAFVLFGHSLGGGIALLAGAQDERVKKIAVYSPAHIGTISKEVLDWIYDYTKGLFMLNVDPKKFYQELKENQNTYNVLNHKMAMAQKQLLIFDENERNKEWIEKLEGAEYILMQTDHSFSDKRLELIEKVLEWING